MSRVTELEQLAREFDKDPEMQKLYCKIFTDVAGETGITVGEPGELIAEPAPCERKELRRAG